MIEINTSILIIDERWNTVLGDKENIIYNACKCALVYSKLVPAKLFESDKKEKELEISIALANDKLLQELNSEYRKKDKPTNVLSFPQIHEDKIKEEIEKNEYLVLGDIVISLDTLQSEADEQNKTLENHFIHLIVHSMLHLLGYDHVKEDDAEKMEALEVEILAELGIDNPYL